MEEIKPVKGWRKKLVARLAQVGLVLLITAIIVGKLTQGGNSAKYMAYGAFIALLSALGLALVNAFMKKETSQASEAADDS
ncbi:MAG: hypothetical protein AB1896_13100 [Thermodesulfobacteriota bacterium]